MAKCPFRNEYETNELKFGFLPSLVIENLESANLQTRITQMSDLVTTVQTTDPNHVNVDQFIDYIIKFLNDQSSIISEKSTQVLISLCHNLHSNLALYKSHFLNIIISNLSSKKIPIKEFIESLFNLMITYISPQTVILDLFSLTLTSSSETISDLLNLITKEIRHSDIDVAFFTKLSFIFEDSLDSNDEQLMRSVNQCLQAIKSKDILTYSKILKNINKNILSKSDSPNYFNRTNAQNYGNAFPSYKKIPTYKSTRASQGSIIRNMKYAPPRISKFNKTRYLSQETFAPSSQINDRAELNSARSLILDQSHFRSIQPTHSATKFLPKRDNSFPDLTDPPKFELGEINQEETEGESKHLLNFTKLPMETTANNYEDTTFQQLLDQMHSDDLSLQNDSIQAFNSKIPLFLSSIISNLREVCSTLLDCASHHSESQEMIVQSALTALQSIIENESINVSPLAEYIAISLLSLYSSDNDFISDHASICLISLIRNIQPQKAIDVLYYESRIADEKARTKVAELFGIMAKSIKVYTQTLVSLAQLAIDESPAVRDAAKKSIFQISLTCDNFTKIVYQFVSEQQVRDIILNSIQ